MNESINIIGLITEASLVVQLVMGVLVFLSFYGWFIVFRLLGRYASANKHDTDFEQSFWSGANLKVLYQRAQNARELKHLESLFFDGFSEFLKLNKNGLPRADMIDGTQRQLRVSLMRQQGMMEKGLSTLATIGSVSPYIGLFGTVWGIMNAFIGLSQSQQASLATVAPGIAEALIATAMGLFAAIPAVIAFNHFTAKSEGLYQRRALFAEEMTALLHRESGKTESPSVHVGDAPVTSNPVTQG